MSEMSPETDRKPCKVWVDFGDNPWQEVELSCASHMFRQWKAAQDTGKKLSFGDALQIAMMRDK